MNQLLNNRIGKPQKKEQRGCLFLIAGSLLALLATGLFVWAVSYLSGVVIESRHGDGVAYALMTTVTYCYGVAFFLFYAILAVWYFSPTKAEKEKRKQALTPMMGSEKANGLSKRSLWLITGGILACVVITGAVAVNTYRLITPEGIRTYCFVETKSYEWSQVSTYVIDCDNDDGLTVTFTMQDGKQYEILGGVNSATAKFKASYASVTHFAAAIDEQMVALRVPRNVRHMERAVKFYKGNDHLWEPVSRLIGYTELIPEPDETVPETAVETETVPASETAADSGS